MRARRQSPFPAGAGDCEPPLSGAGGALARRCNGFGPGVHQLHQVVTSAGVRHVEKHGLFRKIEPCGGIESVRVGQHHLAEAIIGEPGSMKKAVHLVGVPSQCRAPASELHEHERVGIQVGFFGHRADFNCGILFRRILPPRVPHGQEAGQRHCRCQPAGQFAHGSS